ncbi:MAG: chemotaxis protein CheW, partial [Candidatus Margulisiibacteriota bacterium]
LFMFMTFHKIREMGELISSNPTEDELSNDEIKHVKVLFSSIVPFEDIKKELDMPEVEKIEIILLSDNESCFSQDVVEPMDEPAVAEGSEASQPTNEEAHPQEEVHPVDSANQSLVVKEGVKRTGSTSLRVDSERIDSLLNLAGELVINKARFIQNHLDLEKQFGRHAKVNELKESVVTLMRIANEIQEGIMQLRMVAIDQVFNRFPRVVRDISRKLNKEINLVIEGKETELDKSVVEEIGDPLMHLVRNAVDHGIETVESRRENKKPETGTIILRAYHQGSNIVIEIQDDGKGIDVEAVRSKAIEKGIISQEDAKNMSDRDAVNLIFLPGFSTTTQVSDLSGRGVGMDVVKKNVERLNGVVEIVTEKGKGSTFTIKLPLTLAIISTLLTRVKQSVYAIPLVNVIEIVEVSKKEISKIAKKEAIRIRNEVINILRLDEVFALGNDNRKRDKVQVVIIGVAEQRVGFVVDDLIGEQDIVIKLLDNSLVECPGIAGASILGDGKVALIVDVSTLVEKVVQGLY